MRVVLHTADDLSGDLNRKTQGLYVQDFPLKPPERLAAGGDSPFESSLCRYLSALALPGAHAAPLAALVRSHDYSAARGHLIPSVPGYHRGAEMDAFGHLAVKRALLGEALPSALRGAPLIAQASSMGSLNENWLQEKKVLPLVHFNFERHPDLPGIPTIFDAAKTESDRQAMALMVGRLEYGRPFFLPPGVPDVRVAVLRKSFDAAVRDPKFLAEAEKSKIDVDPISGQRVAELVEKAMETPKDVVARVREALAPGGK